MRRRIDAFDDEHNCTRFTLVFGHILPSNQFNDFGVRIFSDCDAKLEAARELRQQTLQAAPEAG